MSEKGKAVWYSIGAFALYILCNRLGAIAVSVQQIGEEQFPIREFLLWNMAGDLVFLTIAMILMFRRSSGGDLPVEQFNGNRSAIGLGFACALSVSFASSCLQSALPDLFTVYALSPDEEGDVILTYFSLYSVWSMLLGPLSADALYHGLIHRRLRKCFDGRSTVLLCALFAFAARWINSSPVTPMLLAFAFELGASLTYEKTGSFLIVYAVMLAYGLCTNAASLFGSLPFSLLPAAFLFLALFAVFLLFLWRQDSAFPSEEADHSSF